MMPSQAFISSLEEIQQFITAGAQLFVFMAIQTWKKSKQNYVGAGGGEKGGGEEQKFEKV